MRKKSSNQSFRLPGPPGTSNFRYISSASIFLVVLTFTTVGLAAFASSRKLGMRTWELTSRLPSFQNGSALPSGVRLNDDAMNIPIKAEHTATRIRMPIDGMRLLMNHPFCAWTKTMRNS